MSESAKGSPRPSTVAIHGAGHPHLPGDPVVPPLVQSATFHWAKPEDGELLYSRYGNNPNQKQVSEKIAALEGTEAAVALASGMGATAMTFLALVEAGDHIVASSYLYGATLSLLREEMPRRGVEITFVDPDEEGAFSAAVRPNTKVVHMELPTNPSLRVFDPRPVADVAHTAGAYLTCDATFASPVNFRAVDVGIDVVIHSATKYLGGHSDLIAGAACGSAEVIREVTRMSRLYGPSIDPNTAWLLDRGIRSLDVRMDRHNSNALAIAEWFETQPGVEQSIYPGLESHPDHTIASELMSGFGGMVSVVLRGGGDAADRFMGALTLAMAAPSLGGVETLVSQPRYTSHLALSQEAREAVGIPDGFVRISVGIEDVEDLKADFARGLRAASGE